MDHKTNQQNTEQKCLDFIRDNLEAVDYFGLSDDDKNEVGELLKDAVANADSRFPDFITGDGLIEHFRITSSPQKVKGAEHIRRMAQLDKDHGAKEQNMFCDDKVNSVSSYLKLEGHSHDNLKQSLIDNFDKHIKSYDKYTGNKDVAIFLIDYTDHAIKMIEVEEDTPDEFCLRETLPDYLISRDAIMLNEIHNKYSSAIKYIIYKCSESIEIIKLVNIADVIKLHPKPYKIIAPNTGLYRRHTIKINERSS